METGGNFTNHISPLDDSTSPPTPQSVAASLASLFLASFAFKEWLAYSCLGFFLEIIRRQTSNLEGCFSRFFFVTAEIPADDDCYDWLIVWLSKQPAIKNARKKLFSTSKDRRSLAILPEEGDDWCDAKSRRLFGLPSLLETYTLWYKRRWVRVRRVSLTNPGNWEKEAMELRILTWNHDIMNELLLEAKKDYLASFEDKICVYVAIPSTTDWILLATRPRRPIQSIILDSDTQNMVLEDVKEFMRSKIWYIERGIPFRRGYLLHGTPGSGKTSLIHSIAGELNLNVFLISLAARGMDDTKLSELIAYLPERCITLIEDIDAAFVHGVNRGDVQGASNRLATRRQVRTPGSTPNMDMNSDNDWSGGVTLSGLLNALDGIGAQEGRILFATTNRYGTLDPALCRPGRVDLHVEFGHASRWQAEVLFKRFFKSVPPPGSTHQEVRQDNNDESHTRKHEDSDAASESEVSSTTLVDVDTNHSLKKFTFDGTSPNMQPLSQPSAEQVEALALRFAESIPERQVSMAALQSFLMMHKHSPIDAANGIGAYTEELLKSSDPSQGEIKRRSSLFSLDTGRWKWGVM